MGHRILIVDDSAMTRALIKRSILLAKFPVDAIIEAENGAEALATVRRESVDLVLADLNMPQMSGEELAHKIIEDPLTRHIPVVIVTANPDESRERALMQSGVKQYVHKPFTPETIRDVLKQVLGGAHV